MKTRFTGKPRFDLPPTMCIPLQTVAVDASQGNGYRYFKSSDMLQQAM